MHDQSEDIARNISIYEQTLTVADIPSIPFHSEPLLNGHGDYAGLTLAQRKKILAAFASLVRFLSIEHKSFVYKKSHLDSIEKLANRMKRDLSSAFTENLEFLQSFEHVKNYYDNGQELVKRALYGPIELVLSKQAIERKRTTMTECRLAQVADYLCTIELAAARYAIKEDGGTYEKFFGDIGSFKKNWLRQATRKTIG
ncbi:ABC transporter [Adlercreutzia aquisgranensis]|uniref:ABC transporter n=1 Tax=Adlercreutzia aquisgranensis TaxID=2941323 RepID=UPI0020421D56|nr:ABC transporter [Adlercreutzia aquisgranensis]